MTWKDPGSQRSLEKLRRSNDVDVAEERDRTAMRDRVQLGWLAFGIRQRAAELIGLAAADHRHRVPEVRCARHIRDVAQLARLPAVADFPERLSAELKVVALLIDG